MGDKIIFRGMLKPQELRVETEKCFIGINLLENLGESYYRSLANKFFDYLQCGKPSVNMNFPEYKKINDKYNCCELIENLSCESISLACKKFFSDKNYYQKMQANCVQAAQEFCWENEEEKLKQIFFNL